MEDKWGWVTYGSLVYKVLTGYGVYVEFTPMYYPQFLGSHKSLTAPNLSGLDVEVFYYTCTSVNGQVLK